MTKIVKLTENDLVAIIQKVISEQSPERKKFITRSSTKLSQGGKETSFSEDYETLKTQGQATEDNETFMKLYRNAQSLVYQENQNGYVKNILVGQEQIDLWEKIKKDDMYFAADIIKKVLNNSKGRERYKYCRLGTRNSFTDLEKLPKTKPSTDDVTPPELDTVILPSTVVQQDFFENNSWRLKPAGENEFFETFIAPYKTALINLRKSYPNAGICVQSMSLESSASRFKNQGEAEDMSFEQLSEQRARGVETFLMNNYIELGGRWCTGKRTTTINAKGQNGDGSSGPNPPKGYSFLPKGTDYSKKNFILPDANNPVGKKLELKRTEFGTPEAADKGGEKAYEKYRYVRPTVKIQVFYDVATEGADDKTLPINTPPEKIIDPAQKYWAALYTWKFTIGKGKKNKSGGRKGKYRIETENCDDDGTWKCARTDVKKTDKKIDWFPGKSAKNWQR
jgi:hypothetical protein